MIDLAQAFVWIMGLSIAFDLWLVLSGRKSISMRTWIAAQAHPTLIMAGTLAMVWLCLELQDHFWYACFAAGMGAHLFSGIPVSPGVMSLMRVEADVKSQGSSGVQGSPEKALEEVRDEVSRSDTRVGDTQGVQQSEASQSPIEKGKGPQEVIDAEHLAG